VKRLQTANLNKERKVEKAINNMVAEVNSLERKLNRKEGKVEQIAKQTRKEQQDKLLEQRSMMQIRRELALINKQENDRKQ